MAHNTTSEETMAEHTQSRGHRLLIVDDEEPIRRLLMRVLGLHEYVCDSAESAEEGREYLKENSYSLVLSDVKMPGESGIEFIQYVLKTYRGTAAVMVTAMDDPEYAETALEVGAYGYIIKPFKPNEVLINVANALRRRSLEIENRAHRENLENLVTERTGELQESVGRLQRAMEGIVQAMAMTVETRDPYTAGHQKRVSDLACAIAEEMGFSEDRIHGLRMAGDIHDLGKISIPAEILSKPTRLTETEFLLIKTHPEVAYNILKGIDFPWPIADMVAQHHEKLDGSGYPKGISNGEMLAESKILVVADVVEAMASHRPYRASLGINVALDEIEKSSGSLYDQKTVEACLKILREGTFELSV